MTTLFLRIHFVNSAIGIHWQSQSLGFLPLRGTYEMVPLRLQCPRVKGSATEKPNRLAHFEQLTSP